MRYFVAILGVLFATNACAQRDSFFVTPRGDAFAIIYYSQNGETIFALSRRFHVPPALLADANGLTYQSGIANNTLMMIPLAAYNQLKDKPTNMADARALYYRVKDEDDLYRISKYANVSQHQLQSWNHLADNTIKKDEVLFVGWVLYDATGVVAGTKPVANNTGTKTVVPTPQLQKGNPLKTATNQNFVRQVVQNKDGSTTITLVPAEVPKPIDSIYLLPPFGKLYMQQTDTGHKVDSEKGPVVFFDPKMVLSKNMFYAFHNTVPRGSIIKVYVPNTQKTILVKVIGTIPDTKQYYNCSIAISDLAKEALGIHEDKAWCELWYAQILAKKPVSKGLKPSN